MLPKRIASTIRALVRLVEVLRNWRVWPGRILRGAWMERRVPRLRLAKTTKTIQNAAEYCDESAMGAVASSMTMVHASAASTISSARLARVLAKTTKTIQNAAEYCDESAMGAVASSMTMVHASAASTISSARLAMFLATMTSRRRTGAS